jgi:UDP-N-acetylglucosamine--N-acetylmuramyl-(pentapeptide) pyrophosphoryl-undecaprenol N-acetylglucosamine transferase
MKMLITGGHLTPALAFIDFVREHNPSTEIVYLGRKYAQESLKQESIEAEEIAQRPGVKFLVFSAAKLHFNHYWTLPHQLRKFWYSLQEAQQILKKEQPDVVVSFGGYLALPMAWVAHRQKIPVITHEQTRSAGVANRWIAKFADKIAVSFAETQTSFPANKTVLTGNLLRPHFETEHPRKPEWFTTQGNKPILYITGGSQGSLAINQTVAVILSQLLENWTVIHQVGKPNNLVNSLQEFTALAEYLPSHLRQSYFIREWLSQQDLHWLYQHATLVLGRAGANTVMELSLHAIPSIFIPLPHSHGNEQVLNAQSMAQVGAAVILPQELLTPESVLAKINEVQPALGQMRTAAQVLKKLYPSNSVKNFYDLVVNVVAQHAHAQAQ